MGGGRSRADHPPLGGLAGPELVKTGQDRPSPCEAPVKTSKPQRLPLDAVWGPGDPGPTARQASRGRKCPEVSLGSPQAGVYFRPVPKLEVAGHTSTWPQQEGPSPAPVSSCSIGTAHWGHVLALVGRPPLCLPSPALTATWLLSSGLVPALSCPDSRM